MLCVAEIKQTMVKKIVSGALAILWLCSASPAHSIERYTAHGGPVKYLTLSADKTMMVSASFDYSAVVWDITDFSETATLIGHDAAVNIAQFSDDGKWLATGGDDSKILLWRMDAIRKQGSDAEPIILNGHLGKIVDLSYSADSRYLISSSWDGSAKIWDMVKADSGNPLLMSLEGHEGPVNAARFSDNGQFVYTAGYDGHIRYWRLRDQSYLRSIIKNGWGVNVMHIDEFAGILAYGTTDGAMVVHDLDTDTEMLRMGEERVPVLSVSQSSDRKQIAFGDAKGFVKIIDSREFSLLRDFKAANGPIWSVLLIAETGDLVVASLDDHITKWQIHDFPPQILESPKKNHRFFPQADVGNGQKQFARKCSVCHTLVQDGAKRAGPSLFGVFGRRAGTYPDYTYSKALQNSDIIWSADSIAKLFTEGPDIVTPGTKMPIQRMKNKQDRDDLIRYLEKATQP